MSSRWGTLVLGLAAAGALWTAAHAAEAGSVAGLRKTLTIEESHSGDASPHLLPLLDRLAGAQFDDGALADAADSRKRALKIVVRSYGRDSVNAADAMIALASVELLRHRYSRAEPLLIAAVPALETRFGTDSPALAGPLAGLARIALARGDVPAAENWAKRATAIADRRPTLTTSEPLRALGAVYAAEQRFDEGEKVLRTAVARDRQRDGADSPETARSLAQLANLLLRAQHFTEALSLIEQAIVIDQDRLGANHPLIADDFTDLGLIYAGLGRNDDAGTALYYAIDLLTNGSSEESTRLAYAELDLVPVLRRLGQADDAEAAFKDAKQILDHAAEEERQREREI
ncbi:MAG TPA: tetratricopeptide repeat protein [Stellaceae bacterium]|nr:tetratricopeptide repeat protein [Stellaceae bacterium]